MTTITYANSYTAAQQRAKTGQVTWTKTLLMLFSRLVLFAVYQALIALIFALGGSPSPWQASTAWWPITAALANFTSIFLLDRMARSEGLRLRDIYQGQRGSFWRDLPVALGLFLLCGPIAWLPNIGMATLLYGDPNGPVNILFQVLPLGVVYAAMLLFPGTIPFAELPTYMGYVLPRLEALTGKRWLAISLAGLALAAQHMTLPLVFDARFLAYRLFMFLPFALFVALVVRWRPRLLPYLMVGHGLIDVSAMMMVLAKATGQM